MLLDKEDREKFIKYLANEIYTGQGIIDQMEKIKSPEVIIKRFRTELAATTIVMQKLQSIEDQVIK